MKRCFFALIVGLLTLPALADPPFIAAVDFSGTSVPTFEVYQGSQRTWVWYVRNHGEPVDITGYAPFMYWTATGLGGVVTAACEVVSATGGVFRAAFSPSDLNYTGRVVYGVGLRNDSGAPTVARQGALVIHADAFASGAAPITLTTNVNWALLNVADFPFGDGFLWEGTRWRIVDTVSAIVVYGTTNGSAYRGDWGNWASGSVVSVWGDLSNRFLAGYVVPGWDGRNITNLSLASPLAALSNSVAAAAQTAQVAISIGLTALNIAMEASNTAATAISQSSYAVGMAYYALDTGRYAIALFTNGFSPGYTVPAWNGAAITNLSLADALLSLSNAVATKGTGDVSSALFSGTTNQYVAGNGTLQDMPSVSGGGGGITQINFAVAGNTTSYFAAAETTLYVYAASSSEITNYLPLAGGTLASNAMVVVPTNAQVVLRVPGGGAEYSEHISGRAVCNAIALTGLVITNSAESHGFYWGPRLTPYYGGYNSIVLSAANQTEFNGNKNIVLALSRSFALGPCDIAIGGGGNRVDGGPLGYSFAFGPAGNVVTGGSCGVVGNGNVIRDPRTANRNDYNHGFGAGILISRSSNCTVLTSFGACTDAVFTVVCGATTNRPGGTNEFYARGQPVFVGATGVYTTVTLDNSVTNSFGLEYGGDTNVFVLLPGGVRKRIILGD